MNMNIRWLAVLMVVMLTGCAGVADSMNRMAGIGVVTAETSTFDGSTVVSATPSWLYSSADTSMPHQTKLGARWSSNHPDDVTMVLEFTSSTASYGDIFLGLDGLEINVGGEIYTYPARSFTALDSGVWNSVSRSYNTSSTNAVVIPLSVLQQMVAAPDCRVRIHTGSGYEDSIFSVERSSAGQATALVSLRELVEKVGAVQAGT